MGKSYEKTPEGMMDVKEVEEFLGVGYQVFRKELKPSNFDYSSGCPGIPRNLYSKEEVLIFDEMYHYSINKDRYNTKQVADILHRSPQWVLDEIVPTDQVIRGKRTYSFYDKKIIKQYLDSKNGIIYDDNFEYKNQIRILTERIKELENELNNKNRKIKISSIIKALEISDVEIELTDYD